MSRRRAVWWKLFQLGRDLVETQADSLRENNECDAAEHGPMIAPLSAARSIRCNQPSLFIEAERRRGDAAPPGYLANQ